MSIVESDCYEIATNPLNNSKAKQLYSFPQGPRFSHQPRVM